MKAIKHKIEFIKTDMVNRIRHYLNRWIFLGIEKADSPLLKRKIVLTNQISFSLFVIAIPVFLYFIFIFPRPSYLFLNLLSLLFFLTIPFLNERGYHNLTRISLCVLTTLAPAVLALVDKVFIIKGSIGANMYFVPRFYLLAALMVPLLLIDLSEKTKLIGCLVLNAIVLLSFDLVDAFYGVGFFQREHETPLYYFSNFHIAVNYLFLLSALFYLQLSNKRYESQILNLNKTLDDRVQLKTKELEIANTDLAAFNFMVSHELKTPLTAAQMVTRTMKVSHADKLDAKGLADIETIDNCLNEMQKLIRSILNFSKLSSVQEHVERQNMNSILDDALSDIELMGIPKNIKVIVKDLPDSKADYAMMKRVFTNLISNAIKYSRNKENALIEIGGRKDGQENIYYVKDTGIGFSMKDREKLFKLFERLHSKEDYEGSGLGLAIVERIIKRHRGSVWAEGKAGEGATFYFSLPN